MAANTPAQAGTDAGAVSHEETDWDSIDSRTGPSKRASAPDAYRRARNRASIPAGSEILPPVGMGVAQCLTSTSKDGEWTRAWQKQGKRRLQQAGGFLRAILTW